MKDLTHRENTLVQERAKGKKVLAAANKAGYLPNATDETRRVEAHKTLQKPHVKAALEAALQKHQITLDNALQPIAKGLKAKKTNEITGEESEDLNIQLKASDRALKLMGVNGDSQNTSFHYHLHAKQKEYDL